MPNHAIQVWNLVVPMLQECGCEFKVVVNPETLAEMLAVPRQEGKYITIYPYNNAEALYIGHMVDNALQGCDFQAPHAGGSPEVKVGSSGLVFSRFGAYDGLSVSPTGFDDLKSEPDDRTKSHPDWAEVIWQ